MTSLLQHKDPSIFPNPEKFGPDHWLNNKTLEKYLVPFSKGTRQCLGINLATAEIYLPLYIVSIQDRLRSGQHGKPWSLDRNRSSLVTEAVIRIVRRKM